jgi:short-subunit dehydrogenase/MoaA/NifB/PqqE/SkfB family radical SAM enzyme
MRKGTSFYSGKTILLTGATGDLGASLAEGLLKQGATLILSSRTQGKLDALATDMPEKDRVKTMVADLSLRGEAERLAEAAKTFTGRVDVLINNAGLGYFALMEETDPEKVRHLFEVNTFSPLALIQALVPEMIRQGSGRIVNIVSSAGRVPIPTVGVYGGSKSALAVMTNTMRLELETKGVDIVNIYPGTVNDSFERNAMRENDRPGLCPTDDCGGATRDTAGEILDAASGRPGEVWLERLGKWMALAAIAWPGVVDTRLRPLRNRTVSPPGVEKPRKDRLWRLWQVESSLACNLKCIMCPWVDERRHLTAGGQMSDGIWQALRPWLGDVASVDFTGGGEPLMQPRLFEWIGDAKDAGCEAGFLSNGMLLSEKVSRQVLDLGLNWIGFSIDGADAVTYNAIRKGADFDRLCRNIRYLTANRVGRYPHVRINFVIMKNNVHQLSDIIHLAESMGADQVNFKQCDVIRGDHGKGFGLFASEESRQVKQLQKAMKKATRLARRLDVNTTAFSFVPEEQPVCDQDPRDSLFIRYDGSVSPCVNLAVGGPSSFLGESMVFPRVTYGTLPEADLMAMWERETARFYRRSFSQRVQAHDAALSRADLGRDLIKLREAFDKAADAMPEAPEGCRKCHYLYDI